MPNEAFGQREALRVNRSLSSGGVDHRDHEAHLVAVRDRGSASLHESRKVPHPSLAGTTKVLIDKVGR
jgi:hypothetical protein